MRSCCIIKVNEFNDIKEIRLIKYIYIYYLEFPLNAKLGTPLSVRTRLEPNIYVRGTNDESCQSPPDYSIGLSILYLSIPWSFHYAGR